ncbi:unnamed protein product [Caenorhabditis sp. 36 PRJEB53466]|nr:unnamed protein product [Caenorhabditis sp. 36 PRJEB53466]
MGTKFGKETTETEKRVAMEKRLVEEHERKMREDAMKRQAEEDEETKRIQQAADLKSAAEKREKEEELKRVMEENVNATKKAVNDFNTMKMQGIEHLAKVETDLKELVDKQIENKKASGEHLMTAETEQNAKDKEELTRIHSLHAYVLNKLNEAQEENVKERGRMRKELEEKEEQKIKEHHDIMIELNKDRTNEQIEGEQKQKALAEDFRQFAAEVNEAHTELQNIELSNNVALIAEHNKERNFEQFRANCKNLIKLFNRFKDNFSREEIRLIGTRDEIEHAIIVTDGPDLADALRDLESLSDELQGFNPEGARDQQTYEVLRNEVVKIVDQIKDFLNEVSSNIISYNKACADLQDQPAHVQDPRQTGKNRLTPSEDEEFDVVTTESRTPSRQAQKVGGQYTPAKQSFSIADKYKQVKELIKSLSEKMLKFNVRASTAFDEMLAVQFTQMTIANDQIKARLTDRPSTSSAPMIEPIESSDISISSSSDPIVKPAIE